MSEIDRQRIAAVRILESIGYCFRAGRWHLPLQVEPAAKLWAEADATSS